MAQILTFRLPHVFGPESLAAMSTAYDEAWRRLSQATSVRPEHRQDLQLALGRCIISLAARGERDAAKLSDYATSIMRL